MLKGKVIINTRPEGSEDLIGAALKELGAIVLSMPLISITPIVLEVRTVQDITTNSKYQWLVFTSKNGVDALFNQLNLKSDLIHLPFKTAVFGERTAMALKDNGFEPDLINTQNTSDDLLKELLPKLQANDKVLLVFGDLASDLLEDGLKSKVSVERLEVYRTVFIESIKPEYIQRIAKDEYDMIIFTSPSGFNSFKHHSQGLINLNSLKIACIGSTTQSAVTAEGYTPLVVAKPSGKSGLIIGLENYFTAQSLSKVDGKRIEN